MKLNPLSTELGLSLENVTSNEVSIRYHEIWVSTPKNSVNFSYSLMSM